MMGQVQFKSLLLETQNSIKSVVPTVEKKSKIPTRMQYLTLKEFESVPKYMKGRIRYDQINKFVDAFNDTITAKYKLLSLPRKELKQAQYKMCQALKQQENDETKGFSFCTDEDLKIYGNVKIDKMTSSMLIVLRHCSKIKLIRGPGSIVRYAILV
ncbi:spindle and kinetochore-associated protein 1-like [Stegodyphus dumicola]|uniref:spindle and kinetochore-associated protein 1-like n=1 Tax=Stegodyphus dumicola TaxID=202533 RepID=UPI0015AD352B|nr:spindle and kinetochore-associated protein 1-like [Stegodyphus dumicola]